MPENIVNYLTIIFIAGFGVVFAARFVLLIHGAYREMKSDLRKALSEERTEDEDNSNAVQGV